MAFKSGYVNIIGKPNAGKSTLMNNLVGERLAITSGKAQTTRHRIQGITTTSDYQIVYSDTPGLLTPAYKLQERMMDFVAGALEDADVILLIADLTDEQFQYDEVINTIEQLELPVYVLLNKADRASKGRIKAQREQWKKRLPRAGVILISAYDKKAVKKLEQTIVHALPGGEPYYPEDTLTDRPAKFFVAEIVREKILKNYHKEIPYSVQVEIEEFKEDDKIARISALIYVMRQSQKGIIIGHKGSKLKKVGTQSRMDIQEFLGKKVHLELYVKVAENWRDNAKRLSNYGYNS